MNERQKNLLNLIITQYIRSASPVGSKLAAQSRGFNLSSATIRNEMAKLEATGYIFQPHPSAGRAPTEKGYQFYVNNYLTDSILPKTRQEFLTKIIKSFKKYEPALIKELAKCLADLADSTVFAGFANNNFYYTGLSHLFSQPEFNEQQLICNVSRVIDHLDSVIESLFEKIDEQTQILIGHNNPFDNECSTVVAKYKVRGNEVLVGILGPMRMDYQNNFSLIKYSQQLINNL